MTIYKLKLNAAYYDDSASGIKTFEIRKMTAILRLEIFQNCVDGFGAERCPDWKKKTYDRNFATSIHSTKLEIGVTPMDNKIYNDTCTDCFKQNVCKFVDCYARYCGEVVKLAHSSGVPVKTSISCTEYSKKVTTIRALNSQGTAIYNDYSSHPDNGTVPGNHD